MVTILNLKLMIEWSTDSVNVSRVGSVVCRKRGEELRGCVSLREHIDKRRYNIMDECEDLIRVDMPGFTSRSVVRKKSLNL